MILNNFNNLTLKLIACYKEQINSNLLPYRTVQKWVCANLFNPNFDVFVSQKLLLKWKRNRPVAYRRIPVISPPGYKPTSLLIEISSRL